MKASRNSAGGAATSAGVGFEDQVSAWFATLMLVGDAGEVPFGLPEGTKLEAIHAQAGEPIDDIIVETSGPNGSGFLFIQAKRGESPSSVTSKDFCETLEQFVHQWLARPIPVKHPTAPWDRPVDPTRDRFVLACGKGAAGTIGEVVPTLLRRAQSSAATLQQLAKNQREKTLRDRVLQTLRTSWQARTGTLPSDEDLLALLRIIRVKRFELAEDGSEHSQAIDRLKSTILSQPQQAKSAWDCLMRRAHEISELQSSITAADLRRDLHGANIALQVPRTYQPDIDALQALTNRELADLGRNSSFRFRSQHIQIARPCVAALRTAIDKESVLVIGQPGAGKSATIFQLADQLRQQDAAVIAVQAEALARDPCAPVGHALRLQHPLVEVLQHWQPQGPAFLLVDAFDAARSGDSSKAIRTELADILQAVPHWTVVVAVRVFDLRHNQNLQNLFHGTPPASGYASEDPDFARLRHFEIPAFGANERNELATQATEVHQAAQNLESPERFGERIWLPFHLRLLAEIIERGQAHALDDITTQLDLLERYWSVRFDAFTNRLAAGRLVEDVARAMLTTEQLTVRTPRTADDHPDTFEALRSADILAEATPGEDERVKFGHHILADYAIGRYAFDGITDEILQELKNNAGWLIQFRPSLDVAFERLWQRARQREIFWLRAIAVETAHLRTIGKLIAPVVAARRANASADMEWLMTRVALDDCDDSSHPTPEFRVLRWTVNAAIALKADRPLNGAAAGPWAWIARQLASSELSDATALLLQFLLWNLTDDITEATTEQLHATGHASRNLLAYWRAQESPDAPPNLVPSAIRLVARTFDSDVAASAAILRPHLTTDDVAARGYDTLQGLAFEIDGIIRTDSAFAAEIFLAAFYRETRDDHTQLGHSRIIPLVQSIRQQFEGARYSLSQHYVELFDADPIAATRVAVRAAAAKVQDEEMWWQEPAIAPTAQWSMTAEASEQSDRQATASDPTFKLDGRDMRFHPDESHVWGASTLVGDSDPRAFVSRWCQRLQILETRADRDELLDHILDVIAAENTTQYLWSEILSAAAAAPSWLGHRLREALVSPIVFTTPGLGHHAGALAAAIYPNLSQDERRAIEQVIVSLRTSLLPDYNEERLATERGRLLRQLPVEWLATDEARAERSSWDDRGGPPPNIPPFRVSRLEPASVPEAVRLGGLLGMDPSDVEAVPNSRIRSLAKPVEEFASEHFNRAPVADKAVALLPDLRKLWNALEHAVRDGVHPKQRDDCWATLVQGTTSLARIDDLPANREMSSFVQRVLRRAAVDPWPRADQYDVDEFDRSPAYGSAPRISAAEGVTYLARYPEFATKDWLSTLYCLARDPVPPVRLQVIRRLLTLYPANDELLWNIVQDRIANDESGAVLAFLLTDVLYSLRGVEADRVVPAVLQLRQRALGDLQRVADLQEHCVACVLSFHLFRDHSDCDRIMDAVAADPVTHEREAMRLLYELRDCLTLTGNGQHGASNERARLRATTLFCRIAEEIRARCAALEATEDNAELTRSLLTLAARAAKELYFGSGSYTEKSRRSNGQPLSADQRKRFFEELQPAFDALGRIGHAAVAHPLLEALNGLLPCSPAETLLNAAQIVRQARPGGLGSEQLAHNEVVTMVQRILANHRDMLTQRPEARDALLDLLDVFVEQGWREATSLTFRIHEIYR